MQIFKLWGSILINDGEALKALGTTEKRTKEVKKSMDELGKMAGEAGKAIAVGITAGAAALGGLLMKTTQSLDRIDKLSQKIGMSRREFQEWVTNIQAPYVEQFA